MAVALRTLLSSASGFGLCVNMSGCCSESDGNCCAAGHCNCHHKNCCADDANGDCQTLGPGITLIKSGEVLDGVECAVVWANAQDEEVGRTVYRYNEADDSEEAIADCQFDQYLDKDRPETALAAACMCLPFVQS